MAKTAYARLVERTGKTAADFRPDSKLGEVFRRNGIQRTPEFERVYFLPRRDWPLLCGEGYLERLSAHLRLPGSQALLRPAQVAILTEAYDFRGALGQLGLGVGKTLATALLPTILNAKRPLLLAPAKLRKKTARDFARARKDWIIHPRIEFVSYQQLGRKKYVDLLEEIQPDVIMCDEVHKLKNLHAAVTKRVKRRMKNAPDTIFVGLSGTITARSLHDYWHLLLWALGPKLIPLPVNHNDLKEWALAVDEKVERGVRAAAGALLELPRLVDPPGADELTLARLGVQHRLRQTPGFVMTEATGVDASMSIELVVPPRSAAINAALDDLRVDWVTPNGEVLVTPVDKWRFARQLACGFYYQWVPGAPLLWLEARRNWAKYVRSILLHSHKYDSPLQVQEAVEAGKLKVRFRIPHPTKEDHFLSVTPQTLLSRWLEERPKFKPGPVAHWIDDSYMRWLLREHVFAKGLDHSIIWVEHVAVGEKLAALSGLPFCHRNACDSKGRFIEDLGGQSVIASVASCGEGVNLQTSWHRNVVVSCMPNGPTWEQMLGRTHRSGQEADEVEVVMLNACPEQEAGFEQAVRDALYAYETTGQNQRLLLVDRI